MTKNRGPKSVTTAFRSSFLAFFLSLGPRPLVPTKSKTSPAFLSSLSPNLALPLLPRRGSPRGPVRLDRLGHRERQVHHRRGQRDALLYRL